MKTRFVVVSMLLVVVVAIGMGMYAWTSRPNLMEIHPDFGAVDVTVTSPIRLVFSRSMRPETVTERLQIEPTIDGSFSWDKNVLTFTPDRTWPSGREINLRLEAGARAASWLAFPMQEQKWSFTTSVDLLAYLWPSDGPADIYALNPTTGEMLQLTHGLGVLEYTVSNDGIMIYFSASNGLGGSDLYQVDRLKAASLTDESYQPKELLDCGLAQCRSPAVSHDGLYLAYEYLIPDPKGGLAPAQIWRMSLASSYASPVGQATHETVLPSWSTLGWLAYYDRTSSAYVLINPQTHAQEELPNQTGQPGSWSLDGEFFLAPEISYSSSNGNHETGSSHLLRYGINANNSEDISGAEAVEDVEGNYSPDGKLIAFARKYLDVAQWSLGRQIWIMNTDGSNPHPITGEENYNHYDLAWSRDSLRLAYVRFNQAKLSDPPELWMIGIDGNSPVQLVIRGYSPIWIP